jgi:hypothetical protein
MRWTINVPTTMPTAQRVRMIPFGNDDQRYALSAVRRRCWATVVSIRLVATRATVDHRFAVDAANLGLLMVSLPDEQVGYEAIHSELSDKLKARGLNTDVARHAADEFVRGVAV